MNKKVVIITGASRAGKDYLAEGLGLDIVKFAAPAKRAFEVFLQLPVGFLDSPERTQAVKHPITGLDLDYTYLDILINAYHVWEDIMPDGFTLPAFEASYQSYPIFAVTDMRKRLEIDFILSRFKQDDILHLRVEGRGTVLSSDDNLHASLAAFKHLYYVENSGTIEEYHTEIKRIKRVLTRFTEDNLYAVKHSVK